MDDLTLAALALFLLGAYLLLFAGPRFPNLPGPELRDYLPGGLVYAVHRHPAGMTPNMLRLKRRHGDVFQLRLGPTRTVVVSSPADVTHVVASSSDFCVPPALVAALDFTSPGGILTTPAPERLHLRRSLRASFNHAVLPRFHARMTDAIAEISTQLRASAKGLGAPPAKQTPVDINNVLSTVTICAILNGSMGASMNLAERQALAKDVETHTAALLQEFTQYPFRQILALAGIRDSLLQTSNVIRAVSQRLIKQRLAESPAEKAARDPDLLDAIIALEDHDMARCVSQVSIFVIAGTQTVGVTLSWALFHLCSHSRVLAKLEAEINRACGGRRGGAPLSRDELDKLTYVRSVLKETHRLTPPFVAITRQATREVRLKGSGVTVPKGTKVAAFLYAAQLDERNFADPDLFIPERWGTKEAPGEADGAPTGACMPFGAGNRGCLGKFFAEYEAPLILAELLRNFRFELACPVEEIRSSAGFIEVPRWSSKKDGELDMGVPLIVRER